MITVKHTGNFKLTTNFFNKAISGNYRRTLEKYGREGVEALSKATPVATGKTASSWEYKIVQTVKGIKLVWFNTNVNDGVPIAILLQYGHGTRNGGFVQGIDYINPAMKPIFDKIASEMWKEVTKL